MSSFNYNPSCYLPSGVASYLPKSLACPPPPSYFTSTYTFLTSPFSSTYTTLRTTMDALMSLPFLSFLLIPTMGSYSTTLNLLFFYLTWSTLVLSHPPLRVELVGSLAIRTLFYVLPSCFFFTFDALLPSAAEGFKAMGSSALPLKNASRKRTFRILKIASWSLLNILLSVLLQSLVEVFLTQMLAHRSALKITTGLPMPWGIAKDLLRGYLLREILSYVVHRYVLHNFDSRLTVRISHLHEDWYHSLATPIPLSASYDHPAAYLIRNFIPTFLPAMLFRFHLLTYLVYLALVSIEETFAYSGYSTVPTNFILGGIARRTDNHVMCGGEGNYGCWGLMDWVFGTSVGGDLMHDIVDEADKHDVQERVQKKGKSLKGNLQKKLEGIGKSKENGGATRRRAKAAA